MRRVLQRWKDDEGSSEMNLSGSVHCSTQAPRRSDDTEGSKCRRWRAETARFCRPFISLSVWFLIIKAFSATFFFRFCFTHDPFPHLFTHPASALVSAELSTHFRKFNPVFSFRTRPLWLYRHPIIQTSLDHLSHSKLSNMGCSHCLD